MTTNPQSDFVTVSVEEYAKLLADKRRMDWLELEGLIGIGDIGYGDYRYYAGEIFSPLREVVDKAMKK